jgi:hypothetical protein
LSPSEISIVSALSIVWLPNINTPFWAKIRLLLGNKGKNGKVFVLNINDIDKFSELQKGEKKFDECEKLQFVNNNFKSNAPYCNEPNCY